MTDDELIQVLRSECGFTEDIATAYVRAHGRCEYCGQDVLRDRIAYGSAALDHLLPKSKYASFINEKANWVLSCALCNSVKLGHDVLEPGQDASEMVTQHRSDLIARARQYIQENMSGYDSTWRRVTKVLESSWWTGACR